MGTMHTDDMGILRDMFLETANAWGIEVNYYEVIEIGKNLYNDREHTYKEPIKISIIFDEHPKIAVLKHLGWYVEEDEFKPLLMYLPIYKNEDREVLNVLEDSLIEIAINQVVTDVSKFQITKKQLDNVFGNYWVCKVVPYRHGVVPIVDKIIIDDSFEYLSLNKNYSKTDKGTGIESTYVERNQ